MANHAARGDRPPLPVWMQLVLAAEVCYRLIYHARYLEHVPFALATFSDGRVYEECAHDILTHPPWGTKPFYLQGLYCVFMALPMTIRAWPSLALLLQLVVAGAASWLLFVTAERAWGRYAAGWALILLLAEPSLAFYENKYLSAELGIACNALVLAAFAATAKAATRVRLLQLGGASALAMLARGNMVLALPFTLIACWLTQVGDSGMNLQTKAARTRAGLRVFVWVCAGFVCVASPLAIRNVLVVGSPQVFPAHGGGTSFFIGNHRHANGLWNDGGGLLTGRVDTEQLELQATFGAKVPADSAGDMGRVLYRLALTDIREQPLQWLRLEARKLWLTLGNDMLTQDYDHWGERELLSWSPRFGVPFSLLLGLGVLGLGMLSRNAPQLARVGTNRAWLWFVSGQVVAVLAANVLFFTSAQHRLPLVPMLAFVAGPACLASTQRWRVIANTLPPAHDEARPPSRMVLGIAVVLVLQGFWPRSHRTAPTAVHHYNLAVVQDWIGEPLAALRSLDRALDLRPDHPVFLLRRAELHRRLEQFDAADRDLDRLAAIAVASAIAVAATSAVTGHPVHPVPVDGVAGVDRDGSRSVAPWILREAEKERQANRAARRESAR